MNLLKRFFCYTLCLVTWPALAQSTLEEVARMQSTPLAYPVQQIHSPITIDGKDSEEIWSSIPWSDAFVDIEGSEKPSPKYNTRVKMVYDSAYLYIYAQMEEPHVWGDITNYDDIIYLNNDFEVFMKPDVHDDHYYELEINPLNTVFDLAMSKPYRFGGKALIHWDIKGLKSAVYTAGTRNDPSDIDQYWGLEIAIPFSGLHSFGSDATPQPNTYWMFNFSRVQWQHSITDGQYARKQENGKLLPEDNWVWSPIGLINMHFPERWGYIQFVQNDATAALPAYHAIKQFGWNMHYLQNIYRKSEGEFATAIDQLPGYAQYIAPSADAFAITYDRTADGSGYQIRLKDLKNHTTFNIDHLGNQTYHE